VGMGMKFITVSFSTTPFDWQLTSLYQHAMIG